MITEVPIVKKGQTIGDVFLILKKEGRVLKSVDYIYVVDKNEMLVGVFSIKEIFNYPRNTTVEEIMQTKLITASPKTDPEKIADLALKHSLKAVPIVESGRLVGVVPPQKITSILNTALRKDLMHFAGIHKSHLEYENSLTVPLVTSIVHRVPWLIIGLVGIILVAAFIGVFEKTLEKYLILAFFIPAIVYLGDALGTQHQTLFVRDLAFFGEELNLKEYLAKQMSIAFLIATIMGIVMFLAISVFWKQPYMALVISLAAFFSLILTSFTAVMITFLIKKSGSDPALGSGPFATLVSDATSIIIYFAVATLLL